MQFCSTCAALAACLVGGLICGSESPAFAEGPGESRSQAELGNEAATRLQIHRHAPVDVEARPIVSRLKAGVERPRRLLLDGYGNLIVADWETGSVLSIDADGAVRVLAESLDEPAGLALDPSGCLYVSTHAQGMMRSGAIVRIEPGSEPVVFAEGLTGPTALAFDSEGNLYVACFEENSIVRIAADGMVAVFAEGIPGPASLAVDSRGYVYAASSTEGSVYRITPGGAASVMARDLPVPSDLLIDGSDHLIAVNFGGTRLVHVTPAGRVKTFAVVPRGTIAAALDGRGNLFLANWDAHHLLKVTTVLEVRCPHCGRPIPVRLRTRRGANSPDPERPPKGPII